MNKYRTSYFALINKGNSALTTANNCHLKSYTLYLEEVICQEHLQPKYLEEVN